MTLHSQIGRLAVGCRDCREEREKERARERRRERKDLAREEDETTTGEGRLGIENGVKFGGRRQTWDFAAVCRLDILRSTYEIRPHGPRYRQYEYIAQVRSTKYSVCFVGARCPVRRRHPSWRQTAEQMGVSSCTISCLLSTHHSPVSLR